MPKRVPTELKILRGTAQPCRINENAPKVQPGVPAMPEAFRAEADLAAAWEYHVALLEPLKLLSPSYGAALASLCRAYVEREQAHAVIGKEGAYFLHNDLHKRHPAVGVAADADKRYRGWLQSFGLTPADRERVARVPEEKPVSEWAEFVDQ